MSSLPRFRPFILFVITILIFASTSMSVGNAVAPDEARWKDGELLAPLPSDPAARSAAIEKARVFGALRAQRTQALKSVVHDSPVTPPVVVEPIHPVPSRSARTASKPDPAALRWLEDLQERLRRSEHGLPEMESQPAAPVSDPLTGTELALTPSALPPDNTFNGIVDTGWDPGAPDIAVGPNHILIATTDRFSIMDKCGNTLSTDLFQDYFNQPATRTYYTPKVVYDSWTPRWIMLYIGTETNYSNSVLYIAVSVNADPLGDWYYYSVQTSGILPGLKDAIAVSVTPEVIYITYNQFNLSTFAFEQAVMLELVKDDVYAAVSVLLNRHVGMLNPSDASPAFAVRPAQMRTYAGDMYFVNSKQAGGNFFTLWKVTGAPGASTLTGYTVPVAAYATPPDMPQPNATLVDAGDCRIHDAVYSSGNLYAVYGRNQAGSATVEARKINVSTLTSVFVFISVGVSNDVAYPTVEVDENDQVTLAYCRVGTAMFLSVSYNIFTLPYVNVESGTMVTGVSNFAAGSQPYRWGPYFGAALDPADGRTVWVHGSYASGLTSWTTRVGAVSGFAPSDLAIEALTPTTAYGFEGGPFSPDQLDFELSNTGAMTANWRVTAIPPWLSTSQTDGYLDPGATETVSFFVNGTAAGYGPGGQMDEITFDNCTGGGGATIEALLSILADEWCPGAQVVLSPPTLAVSTASSGAATEIGVFVTAIEDVTLCAIGVEVRNSPAQDTYARVYSADGTTRGALLVQEHSIMPPVQATMHVIAVNATLSACLDYDIAVAFEDPLFWRYWTDPASGASPFDAGGLVRVRDAEVNGSAADTRLPRIVLFTTPAGCGSTTDLAASAGEDVTVSANDARGLYVTPQRTMRLCSVGITADLVPGNRLTTRIYRASGGSRTDLLAEGSAVVSSPLFAFHDVPVSQVLLAGSQYDIEVEFEGGGAWESYDIPPAAVPYTVDNTMLVYGAEQSGIITTLIPHLRLAWTDEPLARHFDLAKQNDVNIQPPFSVAGALTHGAYITSIIDQEIYSIGVRANIPQGGFITAYLYEATGTTRGPLVSSAVVTSDGAGIQWHDVPISASLVAGADYDIMFSAPAATSWPRWNDSPGLPYTAYGTIQVRDAESGGTVGTSFLAHMRMHACNNTLTDVADGPQRVPMLLDPPAPNPTTAIVRFGYAVDEAGDIEIAVYDVAGKRVAHVARRKVTNPGRDAVDFDTSKLASGVYFVKLTTRTKSTSRKFVVTH